MEQGTVDLLIELSKNKTCCRWVPGLENISGAYLKLPADFITMENNRPGEKSEIGLRKIKHTITSPNQYSVKVQKLLIIEENNNLVVKRTSKNLWKRQCTLEENMTIILWESDAQNLPQQLCHCWFCSRGNIVCTKKVAMKYLLCSNNCRY